MQIASLPACFAEMEANRFCSVGGNGIKLYSNYGLTASISRDQLHICRCKLPLCAAGFAKVAGNLQKPRIAKTNRELPSAIANERILHPCL